MKWLLLAPPEPGDPGPGRHWTGLLAAALHEAGEEVGLVGRSGVWRAWCRARGLRFLPYRFPAHLAPWAVLRLAGYFARYRPDAVLVTRLGEARLARLADRGAAIAWRPAAPEALQGSLAERAAFRYAVDRVFADHHAARRRYLRYAWIHEGAVVTVHHGIDLDGPAPDPPRRARARARLGLEGADRLAVAVVGRFTATSRPMDAVRAFAQAAPACREARLFLVGDGPQRPVLQRYVRDYGLADRVRFLGWCSDARELLRGIDVLLHPAKGEDVPHTVLEAMAAGCAVVAARASGLPEVLHDGVDGLLVAPGDVRGFAACLVGLAGNSATRARLGAAAAARAREHLSSAVMATRVRSAMQEVVEARRLLRAGGVRCVGGWRGMVAAPAPAVITALQRGAEGVAEACADFTVNGYTEPAGSCPMPRRPHAVRNLRMAARLVLLGIRIVPHRGALWRREGPRCRSLLCRAVPPGLVPLEDWLAAAAPSSPAQAACCEAMGRWLAGLHAAGVVPRDLGSQRLLVAPEEGELPGLVLRDLDHSRFRWHVRKAEMVRNFTDFYEALSPRVGRRQMLYFAAAYRRARGLRRARLRDVLASLPAGYGVGPGAAPEG